MLDEILSKQPINYLKCLIFIMLYIRQLKLSQISLLTCNWLTCIYLNQEQHYQEKRQGQGYNDCLY